MFIILAKGKLKVINVNKMVNEINLKYVKVQFNRGKEIKKTKEYRGGQMNSFRQ